jgi:hypothetical protein
MVIVERDDLLEQEEAIRDKMLATIAESYKKPVLLNIPEQYSDYNIKNKEPKKVVMTPIGLVSDKEKQNIQYYIDVVKGSKYRPTGWPKGGITIDNKTDKYFITKNSDGSAVFNAMLTLPGVYKFYAYFKVKRELPAYLPDFLQQELAHMIGEKLEAVSPKVEFTINAKRIGGVKKKEVEFDF